MSPAQRDAVTYAVGEETGPLFARIAELELSLSDVQDQLAELEPMRPLWDALRLSRSTPLVQADDPRYGGVRIALYVDAVCGEPVLSALKGIALKIDSLLPIEVTE